MILITGGTGFIGRALARQLVEGGHSARVLLRPSRRSPKLPTGVPVEVAVSSLNDVRGLRAAMHKVKIVYHLIGGEGEGSRTNLQAVDIDGTRNITNAAADAGVKRIFFVSHLGANRASGFPVLKAKGIAEDYIRKSGIPYTILRGSILFGPHDNFTSGMAMLLSVAPGILPIPAEGKTLLQPLWVEDLVTCLIWALDNSETINHTFDIGGCEYFTLRQIIQILMEVTKTPRLLVSTSVPLLRAATVVLETVFPRFPASIFWLDYLSVNRTCAADTLPQVFGLMPALFATRLDYLRNVRWRRELFRSLSTRNV